MSCWCPRPGRGMHLNPVLSKLQVGGFTLPLFSFDYTPSALTEVHGKNLTDSSENRDNLYKGPERGVLSSLGSVGGCRDGCSSARSWACSLCTHGAVPWGSWAGLAVPDQLAASHLQLPLPWWMWPQQRKHQNQISAIPGSCLCALSPPDSSYVLLLQEKHFLLYNYQKKSVLLLPSTTDPA